MSLWATIRACVLLLLWVGASVLRNPGKDCGLIGIQSTADGQSYKIFQCPDRILRCPVNTSAIPLPSLVVGDRH